MRSLYSERNEIHRSLAFFVLWEYLLEIDYYIENPGDKINACSTFQQDVQMQPTASELR